MHAAVYPSKSGQVWFLALPKGCDHAGESSEKSTEDEQLVFQGRVTVGCLYSDLERDGHRGFGLLGVTWSINTVV